MHKLVLLTATVTLALAACSQERRADPPIENDVAAANVAIEDANMAAPVAPSHWPRSTRRRGNSPIPRPRSRCRN